MTFQIGSVFCHLSSRPTLNQVYFCFYIYGRAAPCFCNSIKYHVVFPGQQQQPYGARSRTETIYISHYAHCQHFTCSLLPDIQCGYVQRSFAHQHAACKQCSPGSSSSVFIALKQLQISLQHV